jgi:Protein of unknown function (DUF1569)
LAFPAAFPRTADRLIARGFRLEVVDASELAKAEGAVTCCSLIVRSALVITGTPQPWGDDVATLQTPINGFTARASASEWPDHPAFGPLPRRAWGVLAYRHIDHHLRQFGV